MKVIDYKKINTINGLCGTVKESLKGDISFARVEMVEGISTAHFHRNTTEYYLILGGRGILRIKSINGGGTKEAKLKEGVLVKIDKNEVHQTNNQGGLTLEAISIPAWTKEDEIESDLNFFEEK